MEVEEALLLVDSALATLLVALGASHPPHTLVGESVEVVAEAHPAHLPRQDQTKVQPDSVKV